ncbi:MAG: 16S rRNA (cytosine(967)-C(5))-methyltransferase RsmB [Limnochordia bacterium]|jgi:16S rRNA (cytosine967-C5)-methyltransferase
MKRTANPRELAVHTLTGLEQTGDFLREVLDLHIQQNPLSPVDRALYTELVYGTVRMRRSIDYVLSSFSRRPINKLPERILHNLRLAVYQIMYLDRVPNYAVVNEAVKLARRFGHQGTASFTNGVLRQVVRSKGRFEFPAKEDNIVEHLGVRHSFPNWIIEHWLDMFGAEETEQLCQAMNKTPELHVRVNTLRISAEDLSRHFSQEGVATEPGRYAPDVLRVSPAHQVLRSPLLAEGMFYVQDESSALAAHALGVNPGMTVYDLCSAPGGKTTHLAQLMNDEGRIEAFDISGSRLALVMENAERLGISIISTKVADAAKSLPLAPADAVLVDAPCSGLGTMGHRPDIRWRKSREEIEELVKVQRSILRNAVNYVRPGGHLLYCTCTLTAWENEEMSRWFLKENEDFIGEGLPDWLPKSGEIPWQRTFLPHRHSLDGFFVALFRKRKT